MMSVYSNFSKSFKAPCRVCSIIAAEQPQFELGTPLNTTFTSSSFTAYFYLEQSEFS